MDLKSSEYEWYLKPWMGTITEGISIVREEIQKLIAKPPVDIGSSKAPNGSFLKKIVGAQR